MVAQPVSDAKQVVAQPVSDAKQVVAQPVSDTKQVVAQPVSDAKRPLSCAAWLQVGLVSVTSVQKAQDYVITFVVSMPCVLLSPKWFKTSTAEN